MSQAGHFSVASSPSVPTSFVTDVGGPAVPVANVLNILGNDTTVNNANGIRTNDGGNTVTVELTNRLQGTVTTVGAVTSDAITFALDSVNPAVYHFDFIVCGRDTGTGDGIGYSVNATARTDGAAATMIQTPDISSDEDTSLAAASVDVVASANNIILQLTGVVGQTINFSAVGTYVVV